MITVVVDGSPQERVKFARRMARDLQTCGEIVVLYEQGFPEKLPLVEPDVIMVIASTDALRQPPVAR